MATTLRDLAGRISTAVTTVTLNLLKMWAEIKHISVGLLRVASMLACKKYVTKP
jgi:hypothetical protein